MSHGFRRVAATQSTAAEGATFVVRVADSEADAIRHVVSQVADVVKRGSVSIDPALQRLFPDGYVDDPAAAAELRRFTEGTLRTEKVHALTTLIETIPAEGGDVTLSASAAHSWLTALTDVRLVLGHRLDITAETDVADELSDGVAADEAEAKVFLLAVYQYLTFLQESLVQAMNPDDGTEAEVVA